MSIKKRLASMALVALAVAVVAPQAMAVTPEGHPIEGGFPVAGTGTSGMSILSTASGTTISCTSGTGTGKATSSTTGEGSGILHGCKGPFGAACTTAGQPSGTIKLETSVSHLVYLDEDHTVPGVLNTPPASGVFAQFTCFGITIVVKGNGMLARIATPKCGEISKTSTVVAETSAPGTQKYLQVEGTGTVYDLQATVGGGTPTTAAIEGSGTGEAERAGVLTCPGQHE